MKQISDYEGGLLNHLNLSYRPGDRALALELVQALGLTAIETPITETMSLISAHPNAEDLDNSNNVIFLLELPAPPGGTRSGDRAEGGERSGAGARPQKLSRASAIQARSWISFRRALHVERGSGFNREPPGERLEHRVEGARERRRNASSCTGRRLRQRYPPGLRTHRCRHDWRYQPGPEHRAAGRTRLMTY